MRARSSCSTRCAAIWSTRGYEVTYVQNFTDIDDKMIRRANEEGITVKELGDRFIAEYYDRRGRAGHASARRCNPRATEHIADIIALIEKLIDKGLAYACDNGDVYYQHAGVPRLRQALRPEPRGFGERRAHRR